MPEIPEMEVYKRQLRDSIIHKKISRIDINNESNINYDAQTFNELINEQLIIFVSRRGKYLIFTLGNGYYLVLDLRPTGRIYYAQADEKVDIEGSVVLSFIDGTKLFFDNLSQGWLHALAEEEMDQLFSELGMEPLGKYFTLENLTDMLGAKKDAIKPLLTDQEFIAGIGKCYADEILFAAGIHPDQKADKLNMEQICNLYTAISFILNEAIANGGYMENSFAKDDKLTGGYAEKLKVYNRKGEKCFKCEDFIEMKTIVGEESFFCSSCQK